MARAFTTPPRIVLLLGATLLAAPLAGCGKPSPAKITERLWVSELPTNPRKTISAFVISDVRARKLGVFYRGSVYRGAHDLFRFTAAKGGKGKMQLLQDGSVHPVRTETCEPSKGFDHCILVHGDPTGVVRYQSRKRWALRKKSAESLNFGVVLHDLSEEDADLQALGELGLSESDEG
ncbi:MAG: hypothetical protein ACYTFT_05125 [Planctomycetota bacterium]